MRTAILISSPVDHDSRAEIAAGRLPQKDFFALADALSAELITPARKSSTRRGRIGKVLDTLRCAWAAFRQRRSYDLIISDVERTGLILALLFKLSGGGKRHVMVCHGILWRRWPQRFFRLLRLKSQVDRLVCYGPFIEQLLKTDLGLREGQAVTIKHPADHHFWRPLPVEPERMIVSAGLLRRDFDTLVAAVDGMDVELVVAASSPWMSARYRQRESIPPNVRFTRCSPQELRELYARSLFVAVPLEESPTQAGSLVAYEAMAMGKAVAVTRTSGQAGMGIIRDGDTGVFIEPGDTGRWREVIQRFCDHPEEAARMGRRAREVVEAGMNMEGYVRGMAAIVESVASEDGSRAESSELRLAEKR